MKRSRLAIILLLVAVVGLAFALRKPLLTILLVRSATSAEVQTLLNAPHHILAPTGWHATPSAATGSVHRWRKDRPVGLWIGYFKTTAAEGWVRAEFRRDGSQVGGHTFFHTDGRVDYQSVYNGPIFKQPPWQWGVTDLTAEEMEAVRRSTD